VGHVLSPDVRGLLFDLDGTLVDSVPDIGRAANAVLRDAGLPDADDAEVRAAMGHGPAALMRTLLASRRADGVSVEEAVADLRAAYARRPVVETRPYPGVRGTLVALQSRGVPMAVVTNKPMLHTGLVLDGLELRGFFGAVVGGDTLAVRKPDPAPVHHAMRQLGVGRALLVGDSVADRDAAAAAGVAFRWAPWGYGDPLLLRDGPRLVGLADLLAGDPTPS
jgi:phosphoglycolate phosphatase